MAFGSCCSSSRFATLTRAAAKSAASRLRTLGLLPTTIDWTQRAQICERCPMRTVHNGLSYCGRPFLQQIDRDPVVDGCGCPTVEKAKDPTEHCPLTRAHEPSQTVDGACDCKWCSIARESCS